MEQIINNKYLDQDFFDSFYGENKEFKSKMFTMFLERAPKAIDGLQQLLDQENWEKLGSAAHKFRSSIDFIGCKELAEIVRKIQECSKKRNNLELLPELISRAKSICNKVLKALEVELLEISKEHNIVN